MRINKLYSTTLEAGSGFEKSAAVWLCSTRARILKSTINQSFKASAKTVESIRLAIVGLCMTLRPSSFATH